VFTRIVGSNIFQCIECHRQTLLPYFYVDHYISRDSSSCALISYCQKCQKARNVWQQLIYPGTTCIQFRNGIVQSCLQLYGGSYKNKFLNGNR